MNFDVRSPERLMKRKRSARLIATYVHEPRLAVVIVVVRQSRNVYPFHYRAVERQIRLTCRKPTRETLGSYVCEKDCGELESLHSMNGADAHTAP